MLALQSRMSTALANYATEFLKLLPYKVSANECTRRGSGQMGDSMWTVFLDLQISVHAITVCERNKKTEFR
jgi:hypothetical protein